MRVALLGGLELLVILLVADTIFVPELFVGFGYEAGKFIRSAKAYFNSLSDELKSELTLLDDYATQTVMSTGS